MFDQGYHFSVFDIVSDIILFIGYLFVSSVVMKTVDYYYDPDFDGVSNITGRTCTLVNQTKDTGSNFSCEEYNLIFAMLTIAFIFLPSLNVIGALYGPRTAGLHGFVWGAVMTTVGGIWLFCSLYKDKGSVISIIADIGLGDLLDPYGSELYGLLFYVTFSLVTLSLGLVMLFTKKEKGIIIKLTKKDRMKSFTFHFLLFPLLFLSSPIIFLIIKGLVVFKPKSELLRLQSTIGSRGEAILEAAPQFALQCYFAFSTLDLAWTQYFSIITSALTLSIPNIEQYVTSRSEEFGPKSMLKNFAVFFSGSLFRILAISILAVFLKIYASVIIGVAILMLVLCLIMMVRCNKLSLVQDTWQQIGESLLLSWLTITNLKSEKSSTLCRMVSSIYWTIVYSILLADIIKNIDNDNSFWREEYPADDLVLVQQPFTLNILLISTLCLGWVSLLLDVVTASVKYSCCGPSDNNKEDQPSFWDGAIFLDGLKYCCRCWEVGTNHLSTENNVLYCADST